MSKPYASGEEPKVGDEIDLGQGQGPRGVVVIVVGGPNAGAKEGFDVKAWEYLDPGIAVEVPGMGLVYEEDPDDEAILIKRHT